MIVTLFNRAISNNLNWFNLSVLDSPNKCNFSEGRSVAIVGIFLAKGKCTMAYTQLTEIERYQIFSLKEA
ncbi:hypothetical protein KKI90_13840, partial [Xenorhabdus bovienii]